MACAIACNALLLRDEKQRDCLSRWWPVLCGLSPLLSLRYQTAH